MIVRPHVKMLSGDYLTFTNLAHDRGFDPHCRICQALTSDSAPPEDMIHLLTQCRATVETRSRILPELLNTISKYNSSNRILSSPTPDSLLTQFILDCSSLNLPGDMRIPSNHPGFTDITRLCSCLIYAVHKSRTRQLKTMGSLR